MPDEGVLQIVREVAELTTRARRGDGLCRVFRPLATVTGGLNRFCLVLPENPVDRTKGDHARRIALTEWPLQGNYGGMMERGLARRRPLKTAWRMVPAAAVAAALVWAGTLFVGFPLALPRPWTPKLNTAASRLVALGHVLGDAAPTQQPNAPQRPQHALPGRSEHGEMPRVLHSVWAEPARRLAEASQARWSDPRIGWVPNLDQRARDLLKAYATPCGPGRPLILAVQWESAGPMLLSPSGQPAGASEVPQSAFGSIQPVQQPPELLPIAQAVEVPRSGSLELIAREADRHTQRGLELAGRGALFAARAEFLWALRVLAQGLDTERQTTGHSEALAEALTALREADDFLPSRTMLEADLDVASIVTCHRTPVLKGANLHQCMPLVALQTYLTFVQQQLARAAGDELAGSMALRALGKLHEAMAVPAGSPVRAPLAKAMAFYQAALLVCPRNYMASNDLGVLLAKSGRPEDARTALEHSVLIWPRPETWRNLATVYNQLGRHDLALAAAQRAEMLAQAAVGTGGRAADRVRWVDAGQFAQASCDGPPPVAKPESSSQPSTRSASRATPERHVPPSPAGSTKGPWPTRPVAPRGPLGQTRGSDASLNLSRKEMGRAVIACQALGPAAPCPVCAVDCSCCDWSGRGGWESARAIAWQALTPWLARLTNINAQGEYVGHCRTAHVPEYRLRVDDQLDMIYRITRDETSTPYQLNVGDELRIESFTDPALNRDLMIQPDGTITLRLLGQVRATRQTVAQLRDRLEELYSKYYKVPAITVTPLKVNSKLEDLRATVDRRAGIGGQSQLVKVTPEGTISLPAIGPVPAQGLTLSELQQELNERYREEVEGIEVIPVLVQRAPRFVYVLGEVRHPGRFELVGPTTALQAISMAGSWNVGANLRQIVIFRRGDDWRLLSTMINLEGALLGKQPCPRGEIWLNDSDVIIVPKGPILLADDFIDLVFTRGIYGVFPLQANINFAKLSSL